MPRIPGLSELLSLLQTQTEALAQLPRTLADLNGTVRELTAATHHGARHHRVRPADRGAARGAGRGARGAGARAPAGLERVGKVLDDPAIDTVPDTIRRIHDDLMPLIAGLRQAQTRMGSVTGLLRRRPVPDDDGAADDPA